MRTREQGSSKPGARQSRSQTHLPTISLVAVGVMSTVPLAADFTVPSCTAPAEREDSDVSTRAHHKGESGSGTFVSEARGGKGQRRRVDEAVAGVNQRVRLRDRHAAVGQVAVHNEVGRNLVQSAHGWQLRDAHRQRVSVRIAGSQRHQDVCASTAGAEGSKPNLDSAFKDSAGRPVLRSAFTDA